MEGLASCVTACQHPDQIANHMTPMAHNQLRRGTKFSNMTSKKDMQMTETRSLVSKENDRSLRESGLDDRVN